MHLGKMDEGDLTLASTEETRYSCEIYLEPNLKRLKKKTDFSKNMSEFSHPVRSRITRAIVLLSKKSLSSSARACVRAQTMLDSDANEALECSSRQEDRKLRS